MDWTGTAVSEVNGTKFRALGIQRTESKELQRTKFKGNVPGTEGQTCKDNVQGTDSQGQTSQRINPQGKRIGKEGKRIGKGTSSLVPLPREKNGGFSR